MPLVKRLFYVNCRGEECSKLSEIITENIPSTEQVDIAITDWGLYITIYGYKSDIKNIWRKIRSIVNSYRSSAIVGEKHSRVSLEYLFNKLKHTFPPNMLVYILKKLNYRAEYIVDENIIVTNASLSIVEDVSKRIVKLINDIKHRVSGTTTKYYVIASCILTNKSIDEVLVIGLENNHLYIDQDGKYRLKIEWRKALEEFINKYK